MASKSSKKSLKRWVNSKKRNLLVLLALLVAAGGYMGYRVMTAGATDEFFAYMEPQQVSSGGEGTIVDEFTASTEAETAEAPAKPQKVKNLKAAAKKNSVTLTWTKPGGNFRDFSVERAAGSAFKNPTQRDCQMSAFRYRGRTTTTKFTDPYDKYTSDIPKPNTEYWYEVRTIDKNGNSSDCVFIKVKTPKK